MSLPAKVAAIPKAFASLAGAINGLIGWAGAWDKFRVSSPLRLTFSEGGHRMSLDMATLSQALQAVDGSVSPVERMW